MDWSQLKAAMNCWFPREVGISSLDERLSATPFTSIYRVFNDVISSANSIL